MFKLKHSFSFAGMIEELHEYGEKQMRIIDVAEQLFATKGFSGTSVRDIALEAGVNLAMISYYFGSKEKLLEAVFTVKTSYIKNQLEDMLQNDAMEPLEKIYKLIDSYVDRMTKEQHFHKIMVREQIKQIGTEISKLILQTKKRNQELIKKLIQEGQKSGKFKKNIDIPFMMMTMIGTANQLISTQHYYRELNNMQSMTDENFQKLIRKKLSIHLKTLFKAILTHE